MSDVVIGPGHWCPVCCCMSGERGVGLVVCGRVVCWDCARSIADAVNRLETEAKWRAVLVADGGE